MNDFCTSDRRGALATAEPDDGRYTVVLESVRIRSGAARRRTFATLTLTARYEETDHA